MEMGERLERYLGREPQIDPSAYVAPGAVVVGDVTLAARSSVWPGAVLRGDINAIVVGEASNIQDGSVVHLADDFGVQIGARVTVGHLAVIHACTVEDECLIGIHATVLDGAVIGHQSIVGAHTLVTAGTHVPPGSLVLGIPGRVVRALTAAERGRVRGWADKYTAVAAAHRARAAGGPAGSGL